MTQHRALAPETDPAAETDVGAGKGHIQFTDETGTWCSKDIIEQHIDPPAPRTPHPCEIGRHRWAWLVDGRQACGYCGKPR